MSKKTRPAPPEGQVFTSPAGVASLRLAGYLVTLHRRATGDCTASATHEATGAATESHGMGVVSALADLIEDPTLDALARACTADHVLDLSWRALTLPPVVWYTREKQAKFLHPPK